MTKNATKIKNVKDELTGVSTREFFEQQVSEYLKNSSVQAPYAVVIVDVSGFQYVNDTFGHMFGDNVLLQVADAIIENIKLSDIVGRIGGDEFIVFLKNVSKGATESICNKIRSAIKNIYIGEKSKIDVYVGAVVSKDPTVKYDDLLQTASDGVDKRKSIAKPGIQVMTEIIGKHTELTFSAIYDRNYMNVLSSKEKRLSELIFDLLEQAKDLDKAIMAVLRLVGEKRGLSRISVYSIDGNKLNRTYVWAKRGVEIPEKVDSKAVLEFQRMLEGTSLEPGMGVVDEQIVENFHPELKERVLPNGAKSIMFCYMLEFGEVAGMMSYVYNEENEWSDKDYKAFKTVTRQISAYTLKAKALKK